MKLKHWLGLAILVAVGTLSVVLWRYQRQKSPAELVEMLPQGVDLALQQLHYTQNENGRPSWTLDAESAAYQRDSSLVDLTAVEMHYFEAGQFGDVDLRADHGRLDQQQQQIELWGQVEVVTDQDQRLLTERLHYDDSLGLLRTAEPFRYRSPQLDMTGIGLRVFLDEGRLQVASQVRTTIHPMAVKERQ